MLKIKIYTTAQGKMPFTKWLKSLKDKNVKYRITAHLDKLAIGNLGDRKALAKGVYEMRLHFAKGYRIYYGHDGQEIILLLCAGDKGSQKNDIKKAQEYWQDYKEANQ